MPAFHVRLAISALPLALALGAVTVRSDPAPPAPSTVTVAGHGLGPGVGMGQYGAYGYASESQWRWSYQQIVQHYYGSAHLEPISAVAERAMVSVNLSALDDATATVVRAHRAGAALRVNGGPSLSGTLDLKHSGRVQDVQATAGDVSVELPGVGWRTYDGFIQVQPAGAPDGTGGQTWNVVPLERYVAGVVPSESPAGWGATGGEAALQAQAVAARSYALAYVAAAGRICDTQSCQVYGGSPTTVGLGADAAYPLMAATTTAGQVMCTAAVAPCPAGDIVATEYSSSTGGYTAGGTFPAVVDAGDAVPANPFHDWSTTVSLAAIRQLYPAIGAITSLRVVSRNGYGANGGRSLEVDIEGTHGRGVAVGGGTFAAQLGLESDWFRFVSEP